MDIVPPPNTSTVKMTMASVVVVITCFPSVDVFFMASANAMAPRSPAGFHRNGGHECYVCSGIVLR